MKNRVFLFGVTGLIGKGFLKNLLLNDYKVVIADTPSSNLKRLATKNSLHYLEIDASNETDMISKINKSKNIYGGFDHIIFNVAITSEYLKKNFDNPFPEIENYPTELWKKTIDVNLTAFFIFVREFLKILKKNKTSTIIATSSHYGVVSPDPTLYENQNFNSFPGYSASKSGLIGLSKWFAAYLSKYNIRVNTISPGGIKNKHNDEFLKRYSSKTMLKRMGTPDEIASCLLFLLDKKNSYTTGQNFIIDGGFSSL